MSCVRPSAGESRWPRHSGLQWFCVCATIWVSVNPWAAARVRVDNEAAASPIQFLFHSTCAGSHSRLEHAARIEAARCCHHRRRLLSQQGATGERAPVSSRLRLGVVPVSSWSPASRPCLIRTHASPSCGAGRASDPVASPRSRRRVPTGGGSDDHLGAQRHPGTTSAATAILVPPAPTPAHGVGAEVGLAPQVCGDTRARGARRQHASRVRASTARLHRARLEGGSRTRARSQHH
ncbi:unnamed protein product [Lampetra planeri]